MAKQRRLEQLKRRMTGYLTSLSEGSHLPRSTSSRTRRVASGIQGSFNWFGSFVPESEATSFLVVGGPSSGKSLLIRMLLQSVLENYRTSIARRLLVYDAKQDILPSLTSSGLIPADDIYILHPFDQRGVAWNVAADIQSESRSRLLAESIITTVQNDPQPIFAKAAKGVLTALFLALHERAPNNWTLRDVCFIASRPSLLRNVLSESSECLARNMNEVVLSQRMGNDVSGLILANVTSLQAIASAWHGKPAVSMADWVRSDKILVLPSDECIREPIQKLNQALLSTIASLIQASEPTSFGSTCVFLDDLDDARIGGSVSSLLKDGEKFGVRTAFSFQSLASLGASYGEQFAQDVLHAATNVAILRASYSGTLLSLLDSLSEPPLEPSQITSLPSISDSACLEGFVKLHSSSVRAVTISMDDVSEMLPVVDTRTPHFVPMESPTDTAFTEHDEARLGLR